MTAHLHYRSSEATCARSLELFGFEECDDCGSDRGLDRGYSILCEECEPFDDSMENLDNSTENDNA